MKLTSKYYKFKLRKICLFLVILGSLNYGLDLLGLNLIDMVSRTFYFGYNINNVLKMLITIASLYLLLTEKNLFKPFLGEAVLPCSVINKTPPVDADASITINTKPHQKIVYWAATSNNDNDIVWDAYGDYSNSGVVFADENGKAVLKFRKPKGYVLPNNSKLSPHIHYRECPFVEDAEGMMGPLKTVFL